MEDTRCSAEKRVQIRTQSLSGANRFINQKTQAIMNETTSGSQVIQGKSLQRGKQVDEILIDKRNEQLLSIFLEPKKDHEMVSSSQIQHQKFQTYWKMVNKNRCSKSSYNGKDLQQLNANIDTKKTNNRFRQDNYSSDRQRGNTLENIQCDEKDQMSIDQSQDELPIIKKKKEGTKGFVRVFRVNEKRQLNIKGGQILDQSFAKKVEFDKKLSASLTQQSKQGKSKPRISIVNQDAIQNDKSEKILEYPSNQFKVNNSIPHNGIPFQNMLQMSEKETEQHMQEMLQKKQWQSQLRSKSQSSNRPKFGKTQQVHEEQIAYQNNVFLAHSNSYLSNMSKTQIVQSQQCQVKGEKSESVTRDVIKAQIQIEQYRMKLLKLQRDSEEFAPSLKELEHFFRQTARNLCKNHLRILLLVTSQQIIQERDKNGKFNSQRKKTKNPNCNHNNNAVFYQPNHLVKGTSERAIPRNKQEALELLLAFIDAPVLDIRQKSNKKQEEQKEEPSQNSSQRLQLSGSKLHIEQPNYLLIIESYFPELRDLGKSHKQLLSTLLSHDLSQESFIELLKELMTHLNFSDKKCIYCCSNAFQAFRQMEFTKVRNFMKTTSYDPVSFVLKTILEPVQRPYKEQIQQHQFLIRKVKNSLSPSPIMFPKTFKKKTIIEKKKTSTIQKININQDQLPPWRNPLFKEKEKALELKERAFYEFINKQRKLNKLPPVQYNPSKEPSHQRCIYKFYIGKGNNSSLVKFCFKQYRWWWQQGKTQEEFTSVHFIWTQWRNIKVLGGLKQLQKDYCQLGLEGLKNNQSDSTQGDTLSTRSDSKVIKLESQRSNLQTPKKCNDNKRKSLSNEIANQKTQKQINMGTFDQAKEQCQYNHMENNFQLSNKKALFYNMKIYYEAIGDDLFKYVPVTFHIKEGCQDREFRKFEEMYNELAKEESSKNIWIVKPGENTNRGCGITVCKDMAAVSEVVNQVTFLRNGSKRSYIIQKYIEKPLLFNKRKFDIRCYSLITSINGNYMGYWYNEGYLRTCSKEFSLKNCGNKYVHLTNDAIQKRGEDYGKFENGNKLSFTDFQRFMDTNHPDLKCNFKTQILPQLKQLATDTLKAVSKKIDPKKRKNTFELFGYDFMIDTSMKVYLIEVNTNPCLEMSSPLLSRLIPQLIENVIKIAVDPIFPPIDVPVQKRSQLPDVWDNKFELVYNEDTDAQQIAHLPIHETLIDVVAEEDMEEDAAGDDSDDDESDSYDESDKE